MSAEPIAYSRTQVDSRKKLLLVLFFHTFLVSYGFTPFAPLSPSRATKIINIPVPKPNQIEARNKRSNLEYPAFQRSLAMITSSTDDIELQPMEHKFKVRTITVFVKIHHSDFTLTPGKDVLETKIEACAQLAQNLQIELEQKHYEVQTIRVATNPFAEFLIPGESIDQNFDQSLLPKVKDRLQYLDSILAKFSIQFCSLGPSYEIKHIQHVCPVIVESSPRFSCSANIDFGDIGASKAAANCILEISKLGSHNVGDSNGENNQEHLVGGLGNFRFCTVSSSTDFIPFFPGARCESLHCNAKGKNSESNSCTLNFNTIGFALGFENGELVGDLLSQCKSISNIETIFKKGMHQALAPLEQICENFAKKSTTASAAYPYHYLGIDNSLNPSLSENGSIAKAIESLIEVQSPFGRQGTMAAAAAITTTLQSLDLKLTGYCGLMLPVCEDQRLSELGTMSELRISQLLCISSVCGVGVDTVPLSGDVSGSELQGLILDVAALAGRWNKSLSCRVFPVPGLIVGNETSFDSPYLCNSRIFGMN